MGVDRSVNGKKGSVTERREKDWNENVRKVGDEKGWEIE